MAGKYQTKNLLTVSVIGLLAGLGTNAYAQNATDDPWLDLGQITLFGSGFETSVMESPASVTVINEEDIKRIAAQTIGDLLRTIPGLRIDEGSFERVIIRGEGGNRVLIKIDGQALTDHNGMGLGTPILVDPSTVERIEVIRGASSVVGGSRAIGGIVNIITKSGGGKPFGGSFSAGYFSATKGYRTNLSMYGSQGDFDYRLNFGTADLGNLETPTGPLVESDFQDRNISAHLGYTFGNHYIALKYQDLDMATNVYTGLPLPPAAPPFFGPHMEIDLPNRDLTKIGLHYKGTDLTPWMSSLTASTYHQTVDREFQVVRFLPVPPPPFPPTAEHTVSTSSDEQITYGFNVDAVLEFAQGHRTKIGMEYENDFVDTYKTSAITPYTGIAPGFPAGGPAVGTTRNEARIKTFSIYALHEADLSDRLTAFLGMRYYKVDADLELSTATGTSVAAPLSTNSDSRLLGSAALVWKQNEQLTLRFSLNQGYTYPNLTQLFITTTAGDTIINGNPNLLPEESITAEIGARFDAGATVIDTTLFYTEAENYIARVADTANPGEDTYTNIAKAKTFGLELYAERSFSGTNLTPYVSATWMRRKLDGDYNSNTPEIFGKLGLRYDWELNNGIFGTLDAYVAGEGAVYRGATKMASGYGTFNVAAEAQLNDSLHLTASLNNIFDKSYEPSSRLPGAERNIKLNLTWEF